MCFSASVSYSTAAVLLTTGIYAVHHARQLAVPYRLWALIPLLFAAQQAFEGAVWQTLEAGNTSAALSFALGFHFFSDFLWPWWLPLCSYLVESTQTGQYSTTLPSKLRRRVFLGLAIFGGFAGSLAFGAMLLHPEWMKVYIHGHSIVYDFSVPYSLDIPFPVSTVMIYGLVTLVPLLFSSIKLIRNFGVLVLLSMALASASYNSTFVSVWCFFAAVLSLYLVYMIRHLAAPSKQFKTA